MAQNNLPRRSFATRPSSNDGSEGVSPASDDHKEQFSNLDDISDAASRYTVASVNRLLVIQAQQAEITTLRRDKERLTEQIKALRPSPWLLFPAWAFTMFTLIGLQLGVGSDSLISQLAWAGGVGLGFVCIWTLCFPKRGDT